MSPRREGRLGVGDVIGGRFRLVDEIGEGGMGRIFEAVDERYDRPAAVKLIARRLAADPEFRARFQREADAAERANHPHILPVWAYGAAGSYLYLATPLCDADLAALVDERGRLGLDETLRLLGQVAWALDWAHGRGVLHRDVKPENILLVSGEAAAHAYLGDFGMARVASAATLTQVGHAPGLSPAYAAPEQWRGDVVSPATDQYALAATLHTCLTGRPPFAGRPLAELREAHLHEPPPAVPGEPAVSRALAVGLAKDPEQRFGSCQELIAAIRTEPPTGRVGRPARTPAIDPRAPTDPEHPSSARRLARAGVVAGATTAARPHAEAETMADDRGAGTATTVWNRPTDAPTPDTTMPAEETPQGRRRRQALVGGALLLVAGLVAAAAAALTGGGRPPVARLADNLTIRTRALPVAVVAGAGSVWVADQRDHTVTRVDPKTGRTVGRPLSTVSGVAQLAIGDDRLWTASPDGHFRGFDARTGRPLGREQTFALNVDDLAVSPGALWVADSSGDVYKLPIRGGALGPASKPVDTSADTRAIAVGDGLVWAVSAQTGFIHGIDPVMDKIVQDGTAKPGLDDVAVVAGQVWAANPTRRRLVRINAATGDVSDELRVPGTGSHGALAGDGKRLVYMSLDDGRATVLDPAAGRLTRLARQPGGASSVALAAGRLWISYETNDLVRSLRVPGAA